MNEVKRRFPDECILRLNNFMMDNFSTIITKLLQI